MNKKWMVLPLALLLVFGLAFFGCSTDADDGDGDDKKGGDDTTVNYDDLDDPGWVAGDTKSLAAGTKITLSDNFEYGAGYQSVNIAWSSLFSSIKENDVYELDIAFTVDRDLEYVLQWGFVDNSAAANYWKTLTKYVTIGGEVDGLEAGDPPKGAYAPVPPAGALVCTTAGGPYTSKERVLVTADPVTLSSVVVVFTTKGAGVVGEGDSGTKGPVDITFSKFNLTKYAWEGADDGDDGEDGKDGSGGGSSDVVFGKIVATGTSGSATGDNGTYEYYMDNYGWNAMAYFPVDLGGAKLSDFASITFDITNSGTDPNYKKVLLWARDDGASFTNGNDGLPDAVGGPGVGGAADSWNYSSGAQNLTIDIDGDLADELAGSGSSIYLAIYVSTKDATINISNITLNK